ncbi:excisionase family DNA binding protein [Oxalobacteraceae bacterium GrIS 2.11]
MGMDIEQFAEIMSTRDAALCLGVSVRTVQLWVENGCLEAWKTPGGHRRIYRQSVNSMLAARNARDVHGEFFEILICGDANESAEYLVTQLKSLGNEVRIRVVQNGYEALIQIGECCPHLLIIDLIASNSNGIQMLDALQNTVFIKTMHIMVVTDLSDDTLEKLGGLHPGVTKFTKPVPFAQMLRLIRVYMDISKSR